jgi:ABC-type oligopeptide transport system substrate-binding subunit
LGIEVFFEDIGPWEISEWEKKSIASPITINGWVADYPDPDNFLRCAVPVSLLKYHGWQDADFDRLVQGAARTPDRMKRMAMYRQADRLLVADQSLLIILNYGLGTVFTLVKPWVKIFPWSPLGYIDFKYILMEDH